MSHTPGPWKVDDTGFISAKKKMIADPRCMPPKGNEQEIDANAALIAAAPALLSALKGCADALREAGKSFASSNKMAARPNLYELHEQQARAAIAQAKGQ